MKIILLLLLSLWTNLAATDEQRMLKVYAGYNGWGYRFRCSSPYSNQCVWLRHNSPFDPTQHGYHYEDKNNCLIRADNRSVAQLRDIFCLLHANYITIEATVGQRVGLSCPIFTSWYDRCVWKRNDVKVDITKRYSYTFHDCSLRIDHVESIDAGRWTCTDYSDQHLIAAYSLALNKGKDKSWEDPYSKTPPKLNLASTLIIVFSVGIGVVSLFLIALFWKLKFTRNLPTSPTANSRRRPEMELPAFYIDSERDRNRLPLPIAAVNICLEALPRRDVSQTPPPSYRSIFPERTGNENNNNNC